MTHLKWQLNVKKAAPNKDLPLRETTEWQDAKHMGRRPLAHNLPYEFVVLHPECSESVGKVLI